MTVYDDLKSFGYLFFYSLMAVSVLWWACYKIRESAFQSGYWKGRQAGWDSHRRMTNIQKKSDEVFDYDNYN